MCPFKDLVYVTYYLDNNLTNPYLQWKKVGAPDFPSLKQLQQIRDAEVSHMFEMTTQSHQSFAFVV